MSARNMAIMNGRLAALDAGQEIIAQFMSTQPHSGTIHMQNYRTAATQANIKRNSDVQAMITEHVENVRTQLQAVVASGDTSTKIELQSRIDGAVSSLRTEIDILTGAETAVNKKLILLDEDVKKMTTDVDDAKTDVKYLRHQLRTIGEQITLVDHFVARSNKILLDRIDALEKVVNKPPPKSEFRWFEFFMILGFLVMSFIGFFLKKKEISEVLMIDY